MNHRQPLATLAARSAAIMGALATCLSNPPPDRGMYKYYGPGRHMAFWHQLGTKPIGKRVLLLPEPRPGPPAEPKIICHPEAGNTKYIPLSEPPHPRLSSFRRRGGGMMGTGRPTPLPPVGRRPGDPVRGSSASPSTSIRPTPRRARRPPSPRASLPRRPTTR